MSFFDILKNDGSCQGLANELEEFLKKIGKKGTDLDDFISEPEKFKENIVKKYNENKKCLDQILKNLTILSEDLNVSLENVGEQLGMGILYSLGDPTHDLEATISLNEDGASKNNYLKSFDSCAFFSTDSTYEKFEKNAKFLANRLGKKWLMPSNEANALVKKIENSKSESERHEIYEDAIGYPKGSTSEENGYILTIVDGIEIKNKSKNWKWLKLYMPNSKSGGNSLWLPGGMTSGGKLEIMVNSIPNGKPYISSRTWYSFKPKEQKKGLQVKKFKLS